MPPTGIDTDSAKLGHRGVDSSGDPGGGAGAAHKAFLTEPAASASELAAAASAGVRPAQEVAPAAAVSTPRLEPWEMPPVGVGDGCAGRC